LGAAELQFMERMAEEEEAAAGSKKAEHKKIEQGQRTAARGQRARRRWARRASAVSQNCSPVRVCTAAFTLA